MKRKLFVSFILVLVFMLSFALVGCKDNSDELIDLKEALSGLEDEIELLQIQIEELEKTQSKDKSVISGLRERLQEAEDELKNQKYLISQLQSANGGIQVHLASKYYLVVGDTFQLFYRSVVQAVNPYGYYIKLTGTVGHQYNRYFEFQPTSKGTYDLKLEVCDDNGVVYGSGTTTLVVNDKTVSSSTTKNILCIGDSLTAGGYWTKQGYTRYTNAGGKINLLGTITSSGVKHEGIGGWQWSTFVNGDTSTGKASPFKSTSASTKISFKDYCTKNGYSGIDECYILLTWNGVGGRMRTFSFDDDIGKYAKILIDQLHSDYPNCKITLLGIPCPSVNAGLGAYYTINISYGDNYAQFVTAQNYNDFLEEWCKDPAYSSFMRFVDVKGQFDSEYNMPTETKKVNTQNTTTELVGNSMGMHPSTNGYNQIGDAFYRALMAPFA
ncbi:MAG: hypothetical protein J6Y42_00170 [Bacilli bacterium]|nr:hypothetical protein [Bacilli bacterium]